MITAGWVFNICFPVLESRVAIYTHTAVTEKHRQLCIYRYIFCIYQYSWSRVANTHTATHAKMLAKLLAPWLLLLLQKFLLVSAKSWSRQVNESTSFFVVAKVLSFLNFFSCSWTFFVWLRVIWVTEFKKQLYHLVLSKKMK